MLHRKKRKYPIPTLTTGGKGTKQSPDYQTLPVSLDDRVRAYGRGVPNYQGARIPIFSH